jgi:hypothetical protein
MRLGMILNTPLGARSSGSFPPPPTGLSRYNIVDHQHRRNSWRIFLYHLGCCLQHCIDTSFNCFLSSLRVQTCPVSHKSTCIEKNLNRVVNVFFVKTNMIPCLPNAPADKRHTQHIHIISPRESLPYARLELLLEGLLV